MTASVMGGLPKSRTGSRLRAAVLAILIAMSAFSSAALAQQAQPLSGWQGTFQWTHVCTGYGKDETHGVADLMLLEDHNGKFTGTLRGSTPQRSQSNPACSDFVLVTPGTFYGSLYGSHRPGHSTWSVQAGDVRTTPGQAVYCGTSMESRFFTVYEGPVFADAFRDLRPEPDGGWKSSGERTFSAGGGTCTTTYSLTLSRGYCGHGPDRGGVFAQSTTGASVTIYSEPSPNSSRLVSAPNGTRLIYRQTKQVGGQTWFYVTPPGKPAGWVIDKDLACRRPGEPLPLPYYPGDDLPIYRSTPSYGGARG
jgi:hypothetical protein